MRWFGIFKNMLEIAVKEYGVKEYPGATAHNPRIIEYMREAGFDFIEDETAWCSIFINWCAKKAHLQRSYKATARSWLDVGRVLKEEDVISGDIVVFYRGTKDGWRGHVGIFINKIGDNIYVLGGNQKDMVCIEPYSAKKLLGYRRLKKRYEIFKMA